MILVYCISALIVLGLVTSAVAMIAANKKGNAELTHIGFKFFSFFVFTGMLWSIAMLLVLAGVQ